MLSFRKVPIVSLKRVEITDSLHLLSSKIGWILTGRIQTNATKKDFALLSSSRNSSLDTLLFSEDASIQSQIEPKLDEFWKLETSGIKETITRTQLSTIITEVEAILNSRPLNYVDEDINSATALTPNDFLSPYSKV